LTRRIGKGFRTSNQLILKYNRNEPFRWPIFPFDDQSDAIAMAEPVRDITSGSSPEPKLTTTAVIAIVDDDRSVREALTSFVRSLGYRSMAFKCAEDLLKSRRRRNVSCMIADVQMPGMTGLELYRHLVTSGQTIPTILITAYPDDNTRVRALGGGVLCYLSKPFGENELLTCIRSSLNS
jgi:CheY-like chemotaxis protein